jgi:hypothetical protein
VLKRFEPETNSSKRIRLSSAPPPNPPLISLPDEPPMRCTITTGWP